MELPQPPSTLILSLLYLSFCGACLSSMSFISALCTALSILLTDLYAMSFSNHIFALNESHQVSESSDNFIFLKDAKYHYFKPGFIISVETMDFFF